MQISPDLGLTNTARCKMSFFHCRLAVPLLPRPSVQHRPVVSGGVSSGRGNLFFHPGRQLQLQQQQAGRPGSSEETACGAGTSTSTDTPAPTPAAEGGEGGKEGAAPAGLSWDAGASGLTFVGLAVMAGGGPEGAPAGGTHAAAGAGAGVGQEVGAAAGPGNSGGAVEGDAGAGGSAGYSGQVAAVRACALAMRGVCGLEGQPVFQRVAVAREGVRPRRQRLQEALGLQEEDLDDDDDEEEEEDGGEAVIVAGGADGWGSRSVACSLCMGALGAC